MLDCLAIAAVGIGSLALCLSGSDTGVKASAADPSIYDFAVKDIDGQEVKLSKYKGEVLMIVNVASK